MAGAAKTLHQEGLALPGLTARGPASPAPDQLADRLAFENTCIELLTDYFQWED